MTPPFWPTLALLGHEYISNRSQFTGRAIAPMRYQRLPTEMQYGPGTSDIAITLSEMVGVDGLSPFMIDHLIRGTTGTLGGELANMPNFRGRPEQEHRGWTEAPFIRSFFINPLRGAEPVNRFHDLADEAARARNGFERERIAGREVTPTKLVRMADMFASASRDISRLRRDREAIRLHPDMEPRAKRERMDEIDRRIIIVAREALRRYDEAE